MLEEKDHNMQDAEGQHENEARQDEAPKEEVAATPDEASNDVEEVTQTEETSNEEIVNQTAEEHQEAIDEVEDTVADDAEDDAKNERYEIPELDYHAMSMEDLVEEFEKLVNQHKVQAIKSHVENLKSEFNQKFNQLIELKKEEFIANGGNAIDFHFSLPAKSKFNRVYGDYREKRNAYYKNLEKSLNENLANRLGLIEELKGLLNVEENINSTYKHFKEIQENWRNAGPIPKVEYNNVWRTYHHHVERFYDFLHLNRDLRDLDFKHNLEEKQKIVAKAQELANANDPMQAFRQLQTLHKIWKEEIGPVAKEHREEVWNQFSEATKIVHDKRQEYFKTLDERYQGNLEVKQEIIAKIKAISEQNYASHGAWQNKIREVEALREAFFNAGKVPLKVNEATWAAFKQTLREFNKQKNAFYKSVKKEQQENLTKKLALIKIAEEHKDSEDFEATTPIMKKVQSDWKKIGHVPKRLSDKIWKQFKDACNHYFDRLHAGRNEARKGEQDAYDKKVAMLETLADFALPEDAKEAVKAIQGKVAEWKAIGRVPYNKKNIESKFHKAIDGLFGKLDMDKQEAEMIKYNSRLENLDDDKINSERIFIRRKIDEVTAQIRQLENNLLFFSNASSDNPMVKKVYKDIERHRNDLTTWKAKLSKLNSL